MSRHERQLPASLNRASLSHIETREKSISAGIAVLIVGLDSRRNGDNLTDPLIWTLTELKSKVETDKSAGELSIPAETRKNGESTESNLFGALAEFCDDTVFSLYIKGHLVKMDGKWHRERRILVGASPADVAVVIYDGALDFPFKPTCPEEISPNGWMKKSELTAHPKLRDLFKQVLELDSEENLIKSALEDYYSNPENRKSVFLEDLDSIERFSSEREFGVDMRTMPWDAKEVAKRLPEAHSLIVEAINLLVEAQGQEKRDYEKEDKIVSELEGRLKSMEMVDYAVGIAELNGVGLRTIVEMPRAWWEKETKNDKEFYRNYCQKKDSDIGGLAQTGDSVKKSWGYWALQRGDRLGYPEDLGKDWYLIFWERQPGSGRVDGFGAAPVNGIRALKLRPYNAHGM